MQSRAIVETGTAKMSQAVNDKIEYFFELALHQSNISNVGDLFSLVSSKYCFNSDFSSIILLYIYSSAYFKKLLLSQAISIVALLLSFVFVTFELLIFR